MNLTKLFTARLIILLAIIAMIILSYLSFSRINRLYDLSEWVNHTNIVKLKLQETYTDLSDADGELNKFLLTRDSTYLTSMFEHEERIKASLEDLANLTEDNRLQRARVNLLDSLMLTRFALMDLGLKQDLAQYEDVAAQITSLNNETKTIITSLKNEESKLLVEREASVAKYKSWTPVMIFAIEIAIIGFLFLAYSHVASELRVKAKLQSELENQMTFIRAILENSVDAIIVFDRTLNILSANKTAINVFKIPEDAIGKSMFQNYPKSRDSISHKAILRALSGEHVHVANLQSQVVDRIYESFFIPLSNGKEIHAVMAIHHDITELVKASRELQKRNDELNISNQQLEQFAYIASHDLQEPLRKIQTFSSLAAENKSDSDKVLSYLSRIDKSAARMSSLVRDVLNYSRLSNSAAEKEIVDLNEILGQVMQDFELVIQEKQASVTMDNLPAIEASRQQMLQLFGNLFSNSLKFCDKLPRISIQCNRNEHHYIITFLDNGIGFEQKYEAHVFEVFKRLHGISAYSGTGIGLAICKRIVDNHNGSIAVQSSPGIGTTFTIHLPVTLRKNDVENKANTKEKKDRVDITAKLV